MKDFTKPILKSGKTSRFILMAKVTRIIEVVFILSIIPLLCGSIGAAAINANSLREIMVCYAESFIIIGSLYFLLYIFGLIAKFFASIQNKARELKMN